MGKITNTQRLTVEQFPDQKDWIGRMFSVVNDYFQKVQSTLNGSIEFGSNIMGQDLAFDFIYASSTANLPLVYKWGMAKKPNAVSLVYAGIGAWSGDFNNSGTPMAVITNKTLVPTLATIAWEFTAEGNVSITDFAIMNGGFDYIRRPVVGQRVVLKVRIQP